MKRAMRPEHAKPRVMFLAPTPAPYRAFFYDELSRRLPQYRFLAVFQEASFSGMRWSDDRPHRMKHVVLKKLNVGPLERCPMFQRVNPGVHGVLERFVPDVLVTNVYGTLTGRAACRWARRHDVPFFLRSDTNFLTEIEKPLWVRALKRCTLRHDFRHAFGAMSLGTVNEALYAYYGLGPERHYRVPFLIDGQSIAALADEERRCGDMRRQLGLGSSRVVLFAGRLLAWKGVAHLLDAFLDIRGEVPDVALVFVGDGPMAEALKQRAGALLGRRVHMVGFLQPKELWRCYGMAEVCVAASHVEPWGLVVNESMAAGTTVVSTRYCAAAVDLLVDGISGRFVPRDNPKALADVLRKLLRGGKLSEMGYWARQRYQEWVATQDPVACFDRAVREALIWRASQHEKAE